MLEKLTLYRPTIIDLFQNKVDLDISKKQYQRLAALEFSSDCWYVIELLMKVLKPFYADTKAIGESEYPTIDLTFFVFCRLEKDFLSTIIPSDAPLFNHMKDCLLRRIIYFTVEQDSLQTKTIMVSCLLQR